MHSTAICSDDLERPSGAQSKALLSHGSVNVPRLRRESIPRRMHRAPDAPPDRHAQAAARAHGASDAPIWRSCEVTPCCQALCGIAAWAEGWHTHVRQRHCFVELPGHGVESSTLHA